LAVLRNKNCFEGKQIDDISDMQRHVVKELKTIPGDQFQECFEQWKHRLTECIDAQAGYFEGDSSS
jgi:hypothetical protein